MFCNVYKPPCFPLQCELGGIKGKSASTRILSRNEWSAFERCGEPHDTCSDHSRIGARYLREDTDALRRVLMLA